MGSCVQWNILVKGVREHQTIPADKHHILAHSWLCRLSVCPPHHRKVFCLPSWLIRLMHFYGV